MTDEEKKAIELLKELRRYYEAEADRLDYRGTLTIPVDEDDSDAIETMLNLIQEQQKEIKEFYKEININTEIHKRDVKIKDLEETIRCLHETDKEYIYKDKIREFIEKNRKEFGSRYNLLDYEDITYEYWVKVDKLIKLLEE